MHIPDGRLARLLPCALLVILVVQACTPVTPAVPTPSIQPATDVPDIGRSFQLALNPAKTELFPGETVVISAIALGQQQTPPNLSWQLEAGGGGSRALGSLSSDKGPAVLYTAPNAAPASVYVVAMRDETNEADRILFTVVAPPPSASFVLTGLGGIWDDSRARDAVLLGLPVKDLLSAAFPDRPAQLAADFPGQWIEDAAAISYDPEKAKALASEVGLSKLAFVTPQDDAEAVDLARRMVKQLESLGIGADIREAPGAEIRAVLETMTAAGEPALGLWQR